MTLLAPLAGILAGALGLSGLVLLHALKLRRQTLRVSSTLLWRDAAQDLEVNTPLRRPRLTLLLVLQALAVLFLAVAIARPALGDASAAPGRVIIVIDATASMRAATAAGTTRFDAAVRSAIDRVEALRRSDRTPEIGVVRFAHRSSLASPPTRSIGDIITAIRSISPTDQPGDTQRLRELLGSLDEPGSPEDDDQTGGADTGRPTLWIYTDAGSVTERDLVGMRGEIIVPGASAGAANLGIGALHATRDPDEPSSARVFVRVVSSAARPTGVVATVETDDERVRVPLEVPASTPDGPGSLTRTISIRAPGEQRISVTLDHQARPDALESDDTAWVMIPDARPPRTAVYAPDAVADPFLIDVIEALAPDAYSVHRATDLDALRAAELVVYDRVSHASLPPAPSLGFGSAWPGRPESQAAEPARTGRERVVAWERAHPVLRGITLAPIVFDRAVGLPGAGSPGVRVLAESSEGPVFTETVAGGNRHLRVAFPLERSNWGVEVGMSIFVAKAFERLAPGTRGEGSVITTTETFDVPASTTRVTASGATEMSAPSSELGIATFGPPERSGIYQLTGSTVGDIAVSMLNPSESAIPIGASVGFGSGDTGASPRASSGIDGRREFWPFALLLAFLLMTAEFFVHAARARV